MASPTLSTPEKGAHACHHSGGLHRKANNLPSCVPGFHHILAPIQSVHGPSAHLVPQFSYVLIPVHGWDLKLQILKDPEDMDPLCSLGGEPHCAVSAAVSSQKSSCTAAQLLRVYDESSDQVICFLYTFLSLADECPFNGTDQVFCPWRCNIPSSKCAPGKE